MNRYVYGLMDGSLIYKIKIMTEDEATYEQVIADYNSGENFVWVKLSDVPTYEGVTLA